MVDTTSVQDDKLYHVKVSRAIPAPGNPRSVLTANTENIVKGKALKEMPADAIVSFEEKN